MEKKELNISRLIWYFLIFSVAGLIIEMMYCFATTGVIESRKGLLYGPFCPIYGVGAVIYICFLNRFKGKTVKLFLAGAFLGSGIEYILSFGLEAIYGNRFWDYSYTTYNLNGRISFIYTVFWAVLAILLINHVQPIIDSFILKIKRKNREKLEIAIIIMFILDALVTVYAVKTYTDRAQAIYFDKIENREIQNEKKLDEILFSNEKMMKIFPNIRIKDENGKELWARDVFNM